MTDLEIRYPKEIDQLPLTTRVSVDIDQNINALRDAILNIEQVLGLDINIGLFTPNPLSATLSDRLNRIERGIAERNLVFREINVSDSLQVLLDSTNKPFVKIGSGTSTQIAPVTILGPLTILAPAVSKPETLIQTSLKVDISTFNPNLSSASLFKGKANSLEPILTIQDTTPNPSQDSFALKVQGNVKVTGKLEAEYSIDHTKLLNIDSTPTALTRGLVKHVTSGDYHVHRKGKYNNDLGKWIVDSSVNDQDYGVISHKDLEGINTLPTQGNDFAPLPGVAYHVTGGDLHDHKAGRGAQIDHGDLANINPKFSNHVTGGDSHSHTSAGDGGQIDHSDLAGIETSGVGAIHITGGNLHSHGLDEDGNPIGDGAQIDHNHLLNIDTSGENAIHVTGGNSHRHSSDGDGGQIDHTSLSNVGTMTHEELEGKISLFRATKTGTATFTSTSFDQVQVIHGLGTDQFNVAWSFNGDSFPPPSDPADIGIIYVADKNSTSFRFKRAGGAIPGPAIKAQMTTALTGSNNDLVYTARTAGSNGNSITIKYEVNSSISTNPTISTSLSSITVFVKSPFPTATTVRTALLSDPVAKILVDVVNASGNDGSGTIADAYGPVNLAGGSDTSGFESLSLDWIAVAKN